MCAPMNTTDSRTANRSAWIEPATSPVHQVVAIRSKPRNKDVGHIGSRSASST
jgi:hypothetical protein